MVSLYIPTPVLEIPERVHGQALRFVVTYCHGGSRVFSGRCGAVSRLFSALRGRLVRDRSILLVEVYLPSGRLLCSCQR